MNGVKRCTAADEHGKEIRKGSYKYDLAGKRGWKKKVKKSKRKHE